MTRATAQSSDIRLLASSSMQRGFLLTGALVAVLAAAAILTLAGERITRELHAARAVQVGRAVALYGDALTTYIVKNYNALSKGQPIAGVARPLDPSAQELIRHLSLRGLAPRATKLSSTAEFRMRVSVPRYAANGDLCEANRSAHVSCRISGLVYVSEPFRSADSPDVLSAVLAANAIGEGGGHTTRPNPATFTFRKRAGADLPPQARLQGGRAGMVAQLVDPFPATQGASDFLRTDGGNTMDAPLTMRDAFNVEHDIDGVNRLQAQGHISSGGDVWAGVYRQGRAAGAWLSGDGNVVSGSGDVVTREQRIWAHDGDAFANHLRFNPKGQNGRGAVAQLDAACGNQFIMAAGPAPYSQTGFAPASQSQEHLYVCTHDVYASGPEIRITGGEFAGASSINSWSYGHAPKSPYRMNMQNPGYFRSSYRRWRPVDQKQAVVQRFSLQDESYEVVNLGKWQMCVDATPLVWQYNATGGGYFMPIVQKLTQDAGDGSWWVRYQRYTHYQRAWAYWGKVICRGKI